MHQEAVGGLPYRRTMETLSGWITAAATVGAVLVSILFGLLSTFQARESARQAKRSAESSEGSLETARKQLEDSTAAQAESLQLAQLQLENSVRAHQDSTQPYVWADLRAREDGCGMMQFMVGNSGPTVATEVRIEFNPPLNHVVPEQWVPDAHLIEELFRAGAKSLPPGRVFAWDLGMASKYFKTEGELAPAHQIGVDITANGPHGPIPPVRYFISLADLKDQALRPSGLGLVEAPLRDVEKRLREIGSTLNGQ